MGILYCTGINNSGWWSVGQDIFRQTAIDASSQQIFCDLNEYAREVFAETRSIPDWDELVKENKQKSAAERVLAYSADKKQVSWLNQNICLNLPFWQASSESARFLLFYNSPEQALAYYLGNHPYQADQVDMVLIEWARQCRAMLTFQLKNPQTSLLVDVASLTQSRARFNELVTNTTEVDLPVDSGKIPEPAVNSVLHEYLASTLLHGNTEVAEIFDELRSVASLLSENDRAFLNIKKRSEVLIAPFLETVSTGVLQQQKFNQLAEEKTLLKSQQAVLENEMEYYFKQQQEQKAIIETMTHQHKEGIQKLTSKHAAESKKLKHTLEELEKTLSECMQEGTAQQSTIDMFEDYLLNDAILRLTRAVRLS